MRKKVHTPAAGSKKVFIFYAVISVLLLILPLKSFVSSVKAVLSYVFIPQIRAAHSTVEYFGNVSDTIKELLSAHSQNVLLEEEIKEIRVIREQNGALSEENERLAASLNIAPSRKWSGVWAKTAYRDPSRWTSIIIDKGTDSGVFGKSAAIGFDGKNIGLVGTVIEEGDKTSKVLLIEDEEFSAVAYLPASGKDGLITGSGGGLRLKYIPLGAEVKEGDRVVTSKNSAIFPEGILIGFVTAVEKGEDFKTHLTVRVAPAVRQGAVREIFVFTGDKRP